jgi:RNA polymerase sigma-70 factor (ECF subfamily)
VALKVAARASAPSTAVSIDDEDLVVRAQSGDRWAEDALYRRHAQRVTRAVSRLLGSLDDVDDVVHDAFLIAFESMARLRDPKAFRSWLMQIAVVRVRRTLRTRRLRRALGLLPAKDEGVLERFASPAIDPEQRADLAAIDRVLARMPADQRVAWMLRYVEGYRLEEVASIAGCSLATVKRRIDAVKRTLDPIVTVRADDEEGAS